MYNILAIDAWGNAYEGYVWNAWYKIAECETLPQADNELFDLMAEKGFLDFPIDYYIEDDGVNIVFCLKENLRPLFAIEYGSAENV